MFKAILFLVLFIPLSIMGQASVDPMDAKIEEAWAGRFTNRQEGLKNLERYFEEAVRLQNKSLSGKAFYYGILIRGMESNQEALEYALNYDQYSFSDLRLIDIYASLGGYYESTNKWDETLLYLKRAETLALQINREDRMPGTYIRFGDLYKALGERDLMNEYYIKAIETHRPKNKPLFFYITLHSLLGANVDHLEEAPFNKYLEEYIERRKAMFKFGMGNHRPIEFLKDLKSKEDIGRVQKILATFISYNSNIMIIPTAYQLMELLISEKRYEEAEAIAKEHLVRIQSNAFDTFENSYLEQLIFINEATNDHKEALYYTKKLNQNIKSASENRITQKVDSLRIHFETEQKEVEIKNKTRSRNFFIIGSILLGLALIGSIIAFTQKIRSNRKVSLQEQKLYELKIQDLEKEKKILGMASMLEGQEIERLRIAKDLHDGLGGLLSSVKAHFGKISGEIKQLESLNVYEKAQEMMDDACDEVRRISHDLMPPILQSQGLSAAIPDLASHFEISHGIKCQVDIRNMENRMSKNKEIYLYRICQELLNNIRKHASASNIEISLYGLNERIQLIVEDNGIGFSSDKSMEGLGLISIASRVDFLKGELDIDSAPGKGTTVSISIPV